MAEFSRVQGTGGVGGTSTAPAATLPAAPAEGSLLIAWVHWATIAAVITEPSGWTPLTQDSRAGAGKGRLFYKVATAGESATHTWSLDTSSRWIAGIENWTGNDPTTALDVENCTDQAASTTHTTPAVDPTDSAERLVVIAFGAQDSALTWSGQAVNGSTAGVTERFDTLNVNHTACYADLLVTSTVAGTYTGTATSSVSNASICAIAIFRANPNKAAATTLLAETNFAAPARATYSAAAALSAETAFSTEAKTQIQAAATVLAAETAFSASARQDHSAAVTFRAETNFRPNGKTDPFPTLYVLISFSTHPATEPVWVDVTEYCAGFAIRRGRNSELDRDEAGTATIQLENHDRRFDPSYTAGPYYGQILPMRRVRISASYGGTLYHLFTGFAEAWPQSWTGNSLSQVTLHAVDAFKVLNLHKLTQNFNEESSSDRATNVLSAIGWPTDDRHVHTGRSTVVAAELVGVSAKQHLDDVTLAENGRTLITGDGIIHFHSRHVIAESPYDTSQATFGDSGTELHYHDINMSYDETFIWNEVRCTREGGAEQIATDATSDARYYTRSLARSGLLIPTDNEALASAEFLRDRYAEPQQRVLNLTLIPISDFEGLWPQVLGRDLADRVTVRRRPLGIGTVIEQVSFIEGISHTVGRELGSWRTTYDLSPVASNQTLTPFWILDDAIYSVLGSTTRYGY